MDSENIFTVTITGANNEVRTFISDCVLVITHNIDDTENFNLSMNTSSTTETMVMLLGAMEQAKQQILNDPKIRAAYELVQQAKEENNA